jgi:transposase InsO family protein
MSEKEFVYQMRLKIFQEADKKETSVTLLCKKHHVSRKWFYKWKKRREKEGDEGLRSKIRDIPEMPNRVSKKIEEQILNFIKEYPTYGPERIEAELKSAGICVGHTGIYNVLNKYSLNTGKSRLEWVRKLSGEVVTQDEITRDKEKAKNNHVEANYPGQLIGEDTFYIGCLKGIGRIYHQLACDCFSSFGAAKVYDNKTTNTSTDFVESHLIKKFAPVKIERILTDCGTEYTTWHQEAIPNHEFEKTCKKLGIKHTTTKVKHPWTNGYVERLNKTLLDEFYSVAFRKKRYESIEELQIDLDNFMDYYNYRRTHQGYKLKKNDYRIPAEAHLQKHLTEQKENGKIKIPESIRDRKEVGKNLTFAYDSAKINGVKEEVLECQLVTTS